MSKRAFYRIVWILSAFAIVGMTVVFAGQPYVLTPPGPMTAYTTGDKTLRFQRPGNWQAHEQSLHGLETEVRFEPARNAHMTLTSDLQGSLLADTVKSGSNATLDAMGSLPGMGGALPKQQSPLETMHALQGAEMAKKKSAYAEYKDGETQKMQIDRYEALVTEFTFQEPGAFGSRPMVGKRVTLLAGERRVTLVYSCLKEMRAVLMPTFDQMRDSLTVGQAGG